LFFTTRKRTFTDVSAGVSTRLASGSAYAEALGLQTVECFDAEGKLCGPLAVAGRRRSGIDGRCCGYSALMATESIVVGFKAGGGGAVLNAEGQTCGSQMRGNVWQSRDDTRNGQVGNVSFTATRKGPAHCEDRGWHVRAST